MDKLFCNPLNLEYRYQYIKGRRGPEFFREAADPTCILFGEKYLLFPSMTGGFWYSDDLVDWRFRETPELPTYDYAPDVREVAGQVVFCASRRGTPAELWRSPDPLTVPFERVSAPFGFWDPDLFCDDDGRVYLYWGCSNIDPLYGIELDPETLVPVGEKVELVAQDINRHGWERKGENNHMPVPRTEQERIAAEKRGYTPWVEGAYMTKNNGTYYLQYAAPGTQYNTYSDGVYTSKDPLGPFEYQASNPFSSAPGGFMQGAGHGSTFKDKHGDWWHVSTMRISVRGSFERRLGLWPCGFDDDGVMYCDQNFACLPQGVCEEPREAGHRVGPAMMLLSKGALASASSAGEGHGARLATDENCRTWWAAAGDDPEPWLELDLGAVKHVEAVQVNLADEGIRRPEPNGCDDALLEEHGRVTYPAQSTSFLLEGSADGSSWEALYDGNEHPGDRTHEFVVLDETRDLRFVRVRDFGIAMGGVAAVSGLRVFGHGDGPLPEDVEEAVIGRSEDGMNILLHWDAVEGAQGYNVRYGTEPDKLYMSWQVDEGTMLDLTTANAGQRYYLAIDSYNESGVTPGKVLTIA